jgi:hypothetical protein
LGKNLHEISDDKGVKLVNFATSKNLTDKSTMFPHRTIHKYTWTSPDGKHHNQIDHILVDRRRHSNIVDVRSYRAADCDTDHCLVVVEMFNLKKLSEAEGKEQFRVEVLNRFAVLEDLDTEVEITSAWETIRENIKISAKESLGYYEPKNQNPWFEEEWSKSLDQRKQAKLQWLQYPSEINGDNLNNVRREASIYFRNKKREYLKDKITELAMNSKNKNIIYLYRGINELKQPTEK